MQAPSLNHTFRLVWREILDRGRDYQKAWQKSRTGQVLGALRVVALAGLNLANGVSWADTFVTTVEAAGVQESQSEWTTVGMETFTNKNGRFSTTFTTNFGYDVRGLPLISGVSAVNNEVGVCEG